jgi:hypothetical protein
MLGQYGWVFDPPNEERPNHHLEIRQRLEQRIEQQRESNRGLHRSNAELTEAFAQFVFKQFGGWWLNNDPMKPLAADGLPPAVERRVLELVEEHKNVR